MPEEIIISRDTWKKLKYNIRRSFDGLEENVAKCVILYEKDIPENSAQARLFFDAIIEFRNSWEEISNMW